MVTPAFYPQEQEASIVLDCRHHLKGCCFDPAKMLKGFVAAPCFGCKEQLDEQELQAMENRTLSSHSFSRP